MNVSVCILTVCVCVCVRVLSVQEEDEVALLILKKSTFFFSFALRLGLFVKKCFFLVGGSEFNAQGRLLLNHKSLQLTIVDRPRK